MTTIGVGFALRGPLGNLAGGLQVLNNQLFDLGDEGVQVGADKTLRGKVESITLTQTVLRDGDKRLIVPNVKFIDGPVGRPKRDSRPPSPPPAQ